MFITYFFCLWQNVWKAYVMSNVPKNNLCNGIANSQVTEYIDTYSPQHTHNTILCLCILKRLHFYQASFYHSYLSDKFLIACHIQSIGSIDETFPCPMVIILSLCLFLISFTWICVLKVRFPYLWMFNFYKIFYLHRWRFGWRQCRPSRQTSSKANSHSKSSWLQLWHFQQ